MPQQPTIREFSIDLTPDDAKAIGNAMDSGTAATTVVPSLKPGRKTFAFDQDSLMVVADGDFERSLWAAFDRVEERNGIVTLAKGKDLVFYLPVAKLQDQEIRRAIIDYVTAKVGGGGS